MQILNLTHFTGIKFDCFVKMNIQFFSTIEFYIVIFGAISKFSKD